MSRVTLLTDFGTRDGFIGAVKGVIRSICPDVPIDDVAHDLPRGDIRAGALALGRYWLRWPPGTVHVAVVDPGVGTARRALLIEADQRILVVPDNGLVTPALEEAERWHAFEVRNPAYLPEAPSRTFHGRDVFAPVAAHAARGIHPSRFGPEIRDPVRLPEPRSHRSDRLLVGQVVGTDRFGNLVTNLPGEGFPAGTRVEVLGASIPVGSTYADVPVLEAVAIQNSDGRLEVAVRDGSAAERLGASIGTEVRVHLP